MEVQKAIQTKRAVRLFSDKSVPREDILAILDAGRRSQSSKNTQPWEFVVIQDKAILKALSETGKFAGHIAGGAFAVAFVAPSDSNWVSFDLGQAAAYMQLAAWERGVGSCIASIYEPEKAKALLGVPTDKGLMAALSFGYPAPDFVPAKMGGRRPLDELTHWDKW